MHECYKFSMPMKAVAKGRHRTTRRDGKFITYTPRATKAAERVIKSYAIAAGVNKWLPGALQLTIAIIFKIPKSWSKDKYHKALTDKIRPTVDPDWDNTGKLVSDALNELAYMDDRAIVSAHVEKLYGSEDIIKVIIKNIGQGSSDLINNPPSQEEYHARKYIDKNETP